MDDRSEADLNLFGHIRQLIGDKEEKKVDVEVLEDADQVFQKTSMAHAMNKIRTRERKYLLSLSECKDLTTEDHQLVVQFQPKVRLLGPDLHTERRGEGWGGYYFRNLEHTSGDRRVLQYLYVWTAQKWFVSPWYAILPAFFLAILSTLVFTSLDFRSALISVLAVSGMFILTALWSLWGSGIGTEFVQSRKLYFQNSMLLVGYAVAYLALLLEIFYVGENPDELFHPTLGLLGKDITFSFMTYIFVVVGIVALFIWLFQPAGTEASHVMDYAPVYVYLKKNGDDWELDKVRFDRFHYFCATHNADELRKKKALDGDRVRLAIDNNWHSFALSNGRERFYHLLGIVLTLVGLVVFFGLYFGASEADWPIEFGLLDLNLLNYVYLPLFIFGALYLATTNWPKDLVNEDYLRKDLAEGKVHFYHLDDNKLRFLWNLRDKKAAFKIRLKLQKPFVGDEDFWDDFRDNLEELLYFTVIPAIQELRKKISDSE